MSRIHLIHWNAAEAKQRIATLEAAGHAVAHAFPVKPELWRTLGEDPPEAIVIDLTRLPSHGRDVALALRQQKATRRVPLVFVGGDAEKVDGIRKLLPDAVYAEWRGVRSALKRAIARPPADPIVPKSLLEGYSGTPLPKKLGIKPGSVVALWGAPDGFERTLGALPDGARLVEGHRGPADLVIWFVRARKELAGGMAGKAARLERGSMWIAWPKKTSPMATDLGERDVREIGLAAGLVDYKVCAIDATWSGLLFTRRKPQGG